VTAQWSTRLAGPQDEDGLVYLWLKSFAHSRFGKSRGAQIDASPAEQAYWREHREIVMRLLRTAETRLLIDPEDPGVFWAFACCSGDVVHYVLAKRRFHREGISAAMFRDLLGERLKKAASYTHELVEFKRAEVARAGLVVPSTWVFDPYWLARVAA
jgi:hypothetical protein